MNMKKRFVIGWKRANTKKEKQSV